MAYKKDDLRKTTSAAAEDVEYIMEAEAGEKHRQKKADTGEKDRRGEAMETQGRRGCKLGRMNLSLSPQNFEYVRTRARIDTTTLSKAVNAALTEARERAEKDPEYIAAREVFRKYDEKEAKK